jgi:tRNA pseudouridine55 synthase
LCIGGIVDRVLAVDKPRGLTSHDVVERIRRSSRASKVGHAGTLDPTATGVLLILIGKATRLAQFLAEAPKEYRGHMTLGRTTDSQDLAGRVLSEQAYDGVAREDVERAFERFTGEIEQIPPMVSALKHHGVPLYALARKGIVVDREPRRVLVERLTLLGFAPPDVEFEVVCSKGTYVRTIAADVGDVLGCGACLGALERRRVGPFSMDAAIQLRDAEALGRNIGSAGCSLLEALPDFPILRIDASEAFLLASGSAIAVSAERVGEAVGAHVRVTTDGVRLLAIGRPCPAPGGADALVVQPVRVFEPV